MDLTTFVSIIFTHLHEKSANRNFEFSRQLQLERLNNFPAKIEVKNRIFVQSSVADFISLSANKHFISVHVGVIEGNGRINTHFYGLIQLGEDQTAEAQFEAMKARFERDNVWTSLRANLVAIILDGAAVNLGVDKGIAKRFEDALKPRHITVVHCANHR